MTTLSNDRFCARLNSVLGGPGSFDLSSVFFDATTTEEESIIRAIRLYGDHRQSRRASIEFEEFRRAVPWIFDSDPVLEAAVDTVITSALVLGHDFLAIADAISRAHPVARCAVDRVVAQWRGPDIGSFLSAAELRSLPVRFGAVDNDGEPRFLLQTKIGGDAGCNTYEGLDMLHADGGPATPAVVKVFCERGTSVPDGVAVANFQAFACPEIARVLDAGVSSSGEPYVAYEHVDGRTLDDWVGDNPSLHDRVRVLVQVARAVERAHAVGLCHLGLTPHNVIVRDDGTAALTDIAAGWAGPKPQAAGRGYGPRSDLAFISPESWRGDGSLWMMSDLYRLSGLAFWLLTLALPNGPTVHDAHALLSDGAAPRRDCQAIPRGLREVICAGLSSEPSGRPVSAAEIRIAFEQWLVHRPTSFETVGRWERGQLCVRRHPFVATGLAVCVLVMAAGWAVADRRSTRELRRHDRQMAVARAEVVGAERRIQSARDVVRAWKDAVIASEGKDPALPMVLLAIVQNSELADHEIRSDLLQRSLTGVKETADHAWESHDNSLEAGLWQFAAAQVLRQSGRDEEASVYFSRADTLLSPMVAASDPWMDYIRASGGVARDQQ